MPSSSIQVLVREREREREKREKKIERENGVVTPGAVLPCDVVATWRFVLDMGRATCVSFGYSRLLLQFKVVSPRGTVVGDLPKHVWFNVK